MNKQPEIPENYAGNVLKESKDFYHEVKSIYEKTGYSRSYQVGHMWGGGSDNIKYLTDIMESDANAVESIRRVQRSNAYSVNSPAHIKEKMVDWHVEYLKQSGHDIFGSDISVQESPVTNPDICISRAGRLLTPDFLLKVAYYWEIQKHCRIPKSNFRVVELGGGGGYLARVLKLFVPDSTYVDIDIPETLYFAYLFLKLNFPDAKTLYVTDPIQLDGGIEQYDFIFIPTKFAESIIPYQFDLFCNTASLGEMSNPNIRHWMDFVQNKLKVKYFFGYNRFLNTVPQLINQELKRVGENECSVLFDSRWKILCWELIPPFARCPYEEPSGMDQQLEIAAEHLAEASSNTSDNEQKSQQIIADVVDEDWIRCHERYAVASNRKPVLATDLTMSGTLFKLWESIRLHPNKTNVAMMLKYLSTLTKTGYPFEEWFYYRKLLKTLIAGDKTLEHKDLWKDVLALSVSYNPFNIRLLYHYIMGFLPYRIRMSLIGLIGRIYTGLRKIV